MYIYLDMEFTAQTLTFFTDCGYKDQSKSMSQHFSKRFLVSLSFAQLSIPAIAQTGVVKSAHGRAHGGAHEL